MFTTAGAVAVAVVWSLVTQEFEAVVTVEWDRWGNWPVKKKISEISQERYSAFPHSERSRKTHCARLVPLHGSGYGGPGMQ